MAEASHATAAVRSRWWGACRTPQGPLRCVSAAALAGVPSLAATEFTLKVGTALRYRYGDEVQ